MGAMRLQDLPEGQHYRYQELEDEVAAAQGGADLSKATRLCVEALGPQVFAFLTVYCRDATLAADSFAEFAVDLWRGLPTFEGRGRLRAWAYVIARHAADRVVRSQAQATRRNIPIDLAPELVQLTEHARQTTRAYLQTGIKQRFRELIETLPQEDQVLLQLRLYTPEKLGWSDIVCVIGAESEENIPREAARLRKRYERLVVRLKEMAKAEGLVE